MEIENYNRPFGFDTGKGKEISNIERTLDVRLIAASKDDYSTFENQYVEISTPGSNECGIYQGTTESGNLILSPYLSPKYSEKENLIVSSKELCESPLMIKRDTILQIRKIEKEDLETLVGISSTVPKVRENNNSLTK